MSQLENSSVSPVYMSQVEANEVMELWAQRQREEAERQGMVTVHDVAEATQLSPQEVQQLLQAVRSSRTSSPTQPLPALRADEIPLLPAVVRVLPLTGIATFLLAVALEDKGELGVRGIASGLFFWSFVMAVFALARFAYRLGSEARFGREVKKRIRLGAGQ